MNFESPLTDSVNTKISNLETLKHSNSASADYLTNSTTAADFLSKSLPTSPSKKDVDNIVKISKILESDHPYDPTSEEILFRTRNNISHSNHRPHPQAIRELSAVVNRMGMSNGINVNNGLNSSFAINTLINNTEAPEEFNLFNNSRSYSNSNVKLNDNNKWPSQLSQYKWNSYLPLTSSSNSTSFSIINKNINNEQNNNTNILVKNSNSTIQSENNSTSHTQINQVNSTVPSSEEKEKVNTTSTVTTSTITTTVTSATSTTDLINNTASTTLTSTTSAVTTQDFSTSSTTTTTTTSTTNDLHTSSIFNPNSKPFSPMASDSKTEKSSLMHSDSNVTLINSHVINNNILTSPKGITPQTPLISQLRNLSLESGGLNKSRPSPNMYSSIFFNESEQNSLFHGSPINNNSSSSPSQVIRHNSLPLSSNTTMLISSERENDLVNLNNGIDLLIRTSQLKFEELIKYKDKLSDPNLPVDTLNHIKKELLIQGWYQHAYYSIRKIRDRLHDIFKLNSNVWMVDIDIYATGDIDITLYYFKLHIHTCYDLKNCIVSEWHGSRFTEISNWWASASLLFNQILMLFKLSEIPVIKPLGKMHLEDKTTIIEEGIRSSKSVDETISTFKKMQAIGRKGSVLNHSTLTPHSASSNITSPLATSSTVIDEVDNINDELILGESVLPVGITHSNSSIISSVPNTTPPTLPIISGNSNIKFPYPGTNIYIRGLPINTTDESLYNLCIRWGKIISSKAIVDMRTNECKGFGFVMYETEDQAHTALRELNTMGYHVSFAKSLTHASQESYSSKLKNLEDLTSMNIYISNLPLDYDNEKLVELFGDFKVLSHRILKNADGTSRGVGFARFGSREVAQHVIELFNNVTLKGAKYPLQVRFADSIAQKKLKNQVATSRKRKDSIREQQQQSLSPSFNATIKKMDDFDSISANKNESETEFDKTQNSTIINH